MTATLYNADDARKAIATLTDPPAVFEIRALDAKLGSLWKRGVVSGYFDNADDAVNALATISTAKAIYITLNPITPDLLARRCNRLDYADKGETTSDSNIVTRRWLLVDLDPIRAAGISATEGELAHAKTSADTVAAYLGGKGWPAPVKALSGNGAHLLYRIDLPADDGGLVEGVLKALAGRFDDGHCAIDKGVFNPARITKLYGTMACKGDNIPARPHRMSQIVKVPDPLAIITKAQIESVIAELSPPTVATALAPTARSAQIPQPRFHAPFDLQAFLMRYGVGVKDTKPSGGGTMHILENCPFNPDHGADGEVAVFEQASGLLGFKCFHNSCSGKHWQDFRQHFEPDAYTKPRSHHQPDAYQTVSDDTRPKVRLSGPNRLLSDFAIELAEFVGGMLYIRNGEIVRLTGKRLEPITAPEFRTWIETFVSCYRVKPSGENTFQFDVTMTHDDASGVLASPQFRERLRPVMQLNDCRLPVRRASGAIELLPAGYDAESQTLTLPTVKYADDMTMAEAVAIMDDLLSEFTFADAGRSKAVTIALLAGLYGKHLLPRFTLRPAFIVLANAEGAGKSMAATVATLPVLGTMPAGCKSDDENEIVKQLVATVREARPMLFLDNLKGRLSSAALEAFCSAPTFEGRKLGVNEYITGENLATLVITGNGLTISPDMRRRSLFIELHLGVERAEDRAFRRPLDVPTLQAMRPQILASLWAMVRHWNEAGQPKPSRSHSAFWSWASIVGGIVEAAGYGCALETTDVAVAADTDGDDMRRLVAEMEPGRDYSFANLLGLAQSIEAFQDVIGGKIERRDKSRFAKLLGRYARRHVADCDFMANGKGHNRTYRAVPLHGQHGQHGVSVITGKNSLGEQPKDHADHATMLNTVTSSPPTVDDDPIFDPDIPSTLPTATVAHPRGGLFQ